MRGFLKFLLQIALMFKIDKKQPMGMPHLRKYLLSAHDLAFDNCSRKILSHLPSKLTPIYSLKAV